MCDLKPTQFYNYSSYEDEDGNVNFVDNETFEIIDSYTVTVPVGTRFQTPYTQELIRKKREQEKRRALYKLVGSELGYYFWLSINAQFSELPLASLTRLMFLCTYATYSIDGKCALMKSERTPLKKNDLQELLSVSRATFFRFWEDVSPKYLIEEKNNNITLVASDIIRTGSLPRIKSTDTRQVYFKVFKQPFRSLYKLNHGLHKRLGYIFKLIPYINREYNILCWNTEELDVDELHPLSRDDLSRILELNINRLDDIMLCLCNASFKRTNGGSKPSIDNYIICYKDTYNKNLLYYQVNPYILYRGHDIRHAITFGEHNYLSRI